MEQQHLDDPQPVATYKLAPVVSLAIVVLSLVPVEARFSSIASSAVQVSVPVSSPVMISQPMKHD
jgi:hypothetical protein